MGRQCHEPISAPEGFAALGNQSDLLDSEGCVLLLVVNFETLKLDQIPLLLHYMNIVPIATKNDFTTLYTRHGASAF